jgi:hypothetical protein
MVLQTVHQLSVISYLFLYRYMRAKFVNVERDTPMQRICGEHGVSTKHDAGSAAPSGEQGEKASRIGSFLRDRETLEGQTQAPIKDSVETSDLPQAQRRL